MKHSINYMKKRFEIRFKNGLQSVIAQSQKCERVVLFVIHMSQRCGNAITSCNYNAAILREDNCIAKLASRKNATDKLYYKIRLSQVCDILNVLHNVSIKKHISIKTILI